jgi:hypothetical protein
VESGTILLPGRLNKNVDGSITNATYENSMVVVSMPIIPGGLRPPDGARHRMWASDSGTRAISAAAAAGITTTTPSTNLRYTANAQRE